VKVKLDENLPERLIGVLQGFGHDVDSVRQERLTGRDDHAIWEAAKLAGRIRRYAPGTHPGLLLIRLAQPGRAALLTRLAMLFSGEAVESWRGCLIVATDHKVRIKRPV
jgi:hypothetical protein